MFLVPIAFTISIIPTSSGNVGPVVIIFSIFLAGEISPFVSYFHFFTYDSTSNSTHEVDFQLSSTIERMDRTLWRMI